MILLHTVNIEYWNQSFKEQCNIEYLSFHQMALHSMEKFSNSVENFPGKTKINNNLEEFQKR